MSHSEDFKPYLRHKEIVRKVAKEHGVPYLKALFIINAYITKIKLHIKGGNDVTIVGFGTFKKTQKAKFMDKRIRKARKIKLHLHK